MDQLPAKRAEDTLLTHDYMSVAVEFDDGRDLSYYWSVALPNETSYRCPLPHWREREWHLWWEAAAPGLGSGTPRSERSRETARLRSEAPHHARSSACG